MASLRERTVDSDAHADEELSLDEARTRFAASVRRLDSIALPLAAAQGAALAADVRAPLPLPPFANSAMDGYAVRLDAGAGERGGRCTFRLVGEAAAGHALGVALRPGEAARIMTGAPLPPGADAVVPVEEAKEAAGRVSCLGPIVPGRHIRRAGEDLEVGALAIAAGATLGPAELALLAALGCAAIPVVRQPRVAILTTGDELRPPGASLAPGAIYDANSVALAAQVREAGGDPWLFPAIPDDPVAIGMALDEAAGADAILTSAGMCAGRHDHVAAAVAARGAFSSLCLRLRPARHVGLGCIAATPLFALPGNPGASLLAFELLVRPALRRMAGHAARERPSVPTSLAGPLQSPCGLAQAIWVRLEPKGDGWLARPAGAQGAGMLSTAAAANGILVVPEAATGLPAGAPVLVLLLRGAQQ